MAILDRFRAQPRQKHPDPAVRLGYVHEIPITEHELLAEIAREDGDARVRRAAAAKLMDPPALAAIARDDADESVRTAAIGMLRDLALESFEGAGEAESLAAIDALPDLRTVAAIAKTAAREASAHRALARVTDVHALGSIARHAVHESVRLAAFAAVSDPQEILAVALNCEYKDPAVAAVERVFDRGELEQIATRAKNKHAARRARALAREIDARSAQEAAQAAAPPPPDPAELERVERERAARAEAAAQEAAEAAARAHAEEEEAARRRDAAAAAEQARREAADAAARQDAERRHGRLAELAGEAETAAADQDLSAARRRSEVAEREWKDLAAGVTVDAELASRFAAAQARVAARAAEQREADQRVRREALVRLQQLAGRLEPLATRADLTLKAGERALRDLRAALAAIPPLPSRKDYDDIVHRLKAAQTALTPKVQELRDITDWQRWANIGIQEQLCEKMEALKAVADSEQAARQVRELQQQWREAADVPRAQGEALWRRFKTAHDEVWATCEAHFAEQAGLRAGNFAKKMALVERAESLAESTNWIQTADEIKKLQAEWKTIGAVTRGQERAIWERFRAACDRFFTRRHADLAQRKTVWAENFAKKEALSVRAEALAESTDWEAAAAEIKKLQAEWKTIGPVKKTRADAIWARFRGACDKFFDRYAHRHDVAREERVAAREAIIGELEALAGAPGPTPEASSAEPPPDLLAKVRALRGRWNQELAARGVDRERAAALDTRYAAAFKAVVQRFPSAFDGTDLDSDANRKRMEALVRRMEDLARSLAGPDGASGDAALSPTARLATMLRDALAANTIGGRVEEDSRLRAASEEARQAQAAWSRIGPVPEDARRALVDRFQRALKRIAERSESGRTAVGSGRSGAPGR